MMFCHSLKNLSLRTRSSEFHSCVLLLPRCLYSSPIGTVDSKGRKKGLAQSAQMSPKFHRSPGVCGKSFLLASCLPMMPLNRNILSETPFAAASTGHTPGGYGGVYAKMAGSAPVHLAETVIISLQEVTGLPWWASIICTTFVLRTAVTLPLSIYQVYILSKVENLQSEIKSLAKELEYEVSVYGRHKGWSEKVAKFHFRKNMKRIVSELYVRDNCHPFKASLIMWVQIPMWIFVSVALRNLSNCMSGSTTGLALYKQLQEGGILWFPDLTIPDSTWILPISLGVINFLLIEIFALRKIEVSRFQRYITNFLRAISVLMIPIAATVPSCMALYWVSSSVVGLSHNLLLRSPSVRRLLRLPRTKADSDTPYRDLLSAFVTKYLNKK